MIKRYVWFFRLSGFILVTFGCITFSDLNVKVDEAQATLQVVATDVQQGQAWLETAKAVTTKIGESDLLITAEAMATQVSNGGLLETAQAFATEQPPKMQATLQALTSQIPFAKEPPVDIPIMDVDKENYVITAELISYTVSRKFDNVLDFYQAQMVANDWEKLESKSMVQKNFAILYYKKSDKICSITLTYNEIIEKTTVMITFEPD